MVEIFDKGWNQIFDEIHEKSDNESGLQQLYVPGPQTSLKCKFFEIEIYTSYESWINKLSIDAWSDNIWPEIQLFEYLESEVQKKSKYWENRL